MIITSLSTSRLQIPLRFRFSQSNNATDLSDSTLIELLTEEGVMGYGEACPRLYVTGEDHDSVVRDIVFLQKHLAGRRFDTLESIRQLLTEELPSLTGLASLCGLELAMLDAWSRQTADDPIMALGGTARPFVYYSGIVPLQKSASALEKLQAFRFRHIKLKVDLQLERNLEKLDLIRSTFGKDVQIRLDANCAWTLEDALQQIPAYLSHGIYSFEQIFPKGNDEQMQLVMQRLGSEARIMADESLTSFDRAKYMAEEKICNAFNLKISKNGGVFNTLKIYKLAREHGIPCQLGAHFGETSLLTRAGLLLAALAPAIEQFEGGYGDYLLQRDICKPCLKMDVSARIPLRWEPLDIIPFV